MSDSYQGQQSQGHATPAQIWHQQVALECGQTTGMGSNQYCGTCFSLRDREQSILPRVRLNRSVPPFPHQVTCLPAWAVLLWEYFQCWFLDLYECMLANHKHKRCDPTTSFAICFAFWFTQGKAWANFVKWSIMTNTSTEHCLLSSALQIQTH